MITKTYYDINDLMNLVLTLEDGSVEISAINGRAYFRVCNFTRRTAEDEYKLETLELENEHCPRLTPENTDAAYHIVEAKIASGEWKKAEVPA